jgi:hypothetical protein
MPASAMRSDRGKRGRLNPAVNDEQRAAGHDIRVQGIARPSPGWDLLNRGIAGRVQGETSFVAPGRKQGRMGWNLDMIQAKIGAMASEEEVLK